MDQVTAVLVVFVTVAVSRRVSEGWMAADAGVTDTLTSGLMVSVAVAVLLGFCRLAAVTVTSCDVVMEDGAVYRPLLLIVPIDGLIAHVTAVFDAHATDALSCDVCELVSVAVAGVTVPVTGPC